MDETPNPNQPANFSKIQIKKIALIGGIIVMILVIISITQRVRTSSKLETAISDATVPTVSVILPEETKNAGHLVLPGNLEPQNSAAIYAQTSGYIKQWFVDIGDTVKAGQKLALLDAPELEFQLAQAKANYQTALAEEKLAQSISARGQILVKENNISKEVAEQRLGEANAKIAATNAAQANVNRLEATQAFTVLTAPFDGVVISRAAQIGDLVISGTAASQPLFRIADSRNMRIYVRVPQNYAALVQPGLKATLTLPEYQNRQFEAKVTRSANAVDVQSGSVLVELQANNPDKALMPGAYTQVHFQLANIEKNLSLPGSAILYREDTPSIAIVDKTNRVLLKPIVISRDEGKMVYISSGLSLTDRVINTPTDSIRTGDLVRVQKNQAPDKKA